MYIRRADALSSCSQSPPPSPRKNSSFSSFCYLNLSFLNIMPRPNARVLAHNRVGVNPSGVRLSLNRLHLVPPPPPPPPPPSSPPATDDDSDDDDDGGDDGGDDGPTSESQDSAIDPTYVPTATPNLSQATEPTLSQQEPPLTSKWSKWQLERLFTADERLLHKWLK